VREVADKNGGDGPVGVTFPGVIVGGVVLTAANMDHSWIGLDADALFTSMIGRPVHMLNDADAAGVAEMRYGVGRGRMGVVVLITLGTGIGSALFNQGVLVPNTELGHIEINGEDAEVQAAGRAQEQEKLSWKAYGKRVQTYLRRLDALIWPELVIVGGGISKESDKLFPHVDIRPEIVAAELRNNAGIVGAAAIAVEMEA